MQITNANKIEKSSNKCPHLAGMVVFQARALYGLLYTYTYVFNPNCEELSRKGTFLQDRDDQTSSNLINNIYTNKEVLVYPNPNKDKIYITSKDVHISTITILDQQGRNMDFIKNNIHDNLIEIPHALIRGYYMILIENNGEKIIKKISIE